MFDYPKHPSNRNLSLYLYSKYQSFPVMSERGALIAEYVEEGFRSFLWAINRQVRTAMFRFDLRFPQDYGNAFNEGMINSFTRGLKEFIEQDQLEKLRSGKRVHKTEVNYLWVKEYGRASGRPHYHFALFLNKDAYMTLGRFGGRDNLYELIAKAWADAIGYPYYPAQRLVHACSNPKYCQKPVEYIDLNNTSADEQIGDAFYRLSYLFKAETKKFGRGCRNFGSSLGQTA
ncbi:inovirus Gp2 family protein [Thiomicrorhabdus xiamenensis]|uniref:Inovirus Gp2 family protein n=1 Tax=Thiomicrorhabdus xiamenensis TaxID=2739063 RepID=A0A7D4NQX9_9GAMM|nr:inovirus Gp2 family protein [Thiomicrorhabdus xiamenensis]QKI89631.1 inovirus Gp2 family protein [Thiomicrorhabdus xiamenensis]